MAKKKISPEVLAKLEEIRGDLHALRELLQSKLDATQRP
jgi:hypothetical protein